MREDVLRLMRNKRSVFLGFLSAVLLLSGCVMRPKDSAPLRETAAEPTPELGPVRYRVEFRQDDFALSVQSVEEGSAPEVPAGAEHARLIGWTSGDGRPRPAPAQALQDTLRK